MKKHKQTIRPTNDSERSPAVHYANWKETIFLRKNLATLNKTERGLVHRITVDQKVIFRRFQNKLLRTKKTQARVSGNKQQLQELQSQDMRRLHCESHSFNQGDNSFLDKLEKNPYTFDSKTEARPSGGKSSKGEPAQKVTDQDMMSLIQAVMKNQPIEHTPHNLRRLSALGHILDIARDKEQCPQENAPDTNAKTFKERPFTTASAHHPQNNLLSTRNTIVGSKSFTDVSSRHFQDGCEDFIHEDSVDGTLGHTMSNAKLVDASQRQNGNDSTSSECESVKESDHINLEKLMDKMNLDSNNNKVNKLLSLRANAKISAIQAFKSPIDRTTSIFEEVKRPDFRGMRLQEAKKVDYSGHVRDFIDGLATFGQGLPDFDYYASKMQSNAALQVKTVLPLQLPVTPFEEYRKHTGDQTISCITLPKVKMRKANEVRPHQDSDYFLYPADLFVNTLDSSNNSNVSDEDEDEGYGEK